MQKPTVRLDPDLHQEAKVLVGHLGHTSLEVVINKALEAYLRLHAKEIKKIKSSE